MSSLQTQTTSFKAECWQAIHNLLTDTLKIALYNNTASLDAATTGYTSTGEISGAGYAAGGQVLTGAAIGSSGYVVFADFSDPVWSGTLTARYALIYNSSKSNKSVAVLDFGANKTPINTFTVQFPVGTATTALLRSSN